MAFVLTKKTKFNTKFKENNLYFLSELKRRLTLKNWTKDSIVVMLFVWQLLNIHIVGILFL